MQFRKCLLLVASLVYGQAHAINNGNAVNESDWQSKSVVAIYRYSGSIESYCTGTVISRTQILTAAHCFGTNSTDPDFRFSRVLLGVDVNSARLGNPIKDESNVPSIKIKNVILHNTIQRLGDADDIAIIELTNKLPKKYVPVRLATREVSVVGSELLIAGYGLDLSASMYAFNPIRMKSAVLTTSPIRENDLTDYFLNNQDRIIHMSASERVIGCKGDSGGPAFLKDNNGWVQVGVFHGTTSKQATSSLVPRCPAEESYYTDVSKYTDWVSQHLKH